LRYFVMSRPDEAEKKVADGEGEKLRRMKERLIRRNRAKRNVCTAN